MLLGGTSNTEVLYVLVWVIVALRGYVGSMAMAMLGSVEWEGPGSGDDNTSIASGSGNLQNNVSCYSCHLKYYHTIICVCLRARTCVRVCGDIHIFSINILFWQEYIFHKCHYICLCLYIPFLQQYKRGKGCQISHYFDWNFSSK